MGLYHPVLDLKCSSLVPLSSHTLARSCAHLEHLGAIFFERFLAGNFTSGHAVVVL